MPIGLETLSTPPVEKEVSSVTEGRENHAAPAEPHPGTDPQGTTAPEAPAAGCSASCSDPHDHSDHNHPMTGVEVVAQLVRGLSIVALVIPALGVALLIAGLAYAPSSPFVLAIGIALGLAQLGVVVVSSLVVARNSARWAISPVLQAVRSVVEELLRLGAVFLSLTLLTWDNPSRVGTWLGLGTALVWIILATAQTVAARRRIARPGEWAEDAVATLLGGRVSVTRTMVMRVLDVAGTALFQIGATLLMVASPVMVVPAIILSFATGMSTLILQRHPAGERVHSPWAFVPALVGVLALALGIFAVSSL